MKSMPEATYLEFRAPEMPAARVTVFCNLKGGVGKTTCAINLAAALARGVPSGPDGAPAVPPQKVLLIDCEPLQTASKTLQVQASTFDHSSALLFEKPSSLAFDVEGHAAVIRSLIQPAPYEPLDVIPSHTAGLEEASGQRSSEFFLADNLAALEMDYDHIVIDLPAASRQRVMRSALIAADGIVVPVPPSSQDIDSMSTTFETIDEVRQGANVDLKIDGWLLNRAGAKGDLDAVVVHDLLKDSSPHYVFRARIRTLKPIARAAMSGCSVFGAPSNKAVEDFHAFAREWYQRIQEEE